MTELSLNPVQPKPTAPARENTPSRPTRPWRAWGLRAVAISYLLVFILIPLVVVAVQGWRNGLEEFFTSIARPAALSAIWLTLWTSFIMSLVNTVMGTLTAYVLAAYRFPGKQLFNTLVDLPFSIPALVVGVMIVLLYGPQTAVGGFFEKQLGFRVIFAPPGIVLALLFVSYPLVVRTVQPVLERLETSHEEAAYTIGASMWTTFRRVVLPAISPAMLTGMLLSFARSLGEFGSAIIVSGNIPMRSQTASVYVYSQVEGGNIQSASAVSFILLFLAFTITLAADLYMRRRYNA